MKQLTKHIPNTITLCNLLCGCGAVVFAFLGDFHSAFWAVVLGVVFDFADGLAARLFKAYSPLGLQLDSLADMVTSGVAPSAVLFVALGGVAQPWAWGVWVLAMGAALRLAKFNIDTEQSSEFRGLPTPAMSLFVVSYVLWTGTPPLFVSLLVAVVLSGFMVSRLPMFSLKFKSWGVRENWVRYLFVALAILAGVWWGIYGLPVVMIATYILYSLVAALWKR